MPPSAKIAAMKTSAERLGFIAAALEDANRLEEEKAMMKGVHKKASKKREDLDFATELVSITKKMIADSASATKTVDNGTTTTAIDGRLLSLPLPRSTILLAPLAAARRQRLAASTEDGSPTVPSSHHMQEAMSHLGSAMKAKELQYRFQQIEMWDNMHQVVLSLLQKNSGGDQDGEQHSRSTSPEEEGAESDVLSLHAFETLIIPEFDEYCAERGYQLPHHRSILMASEVNSAFELSTTSRGAAAPSPALSLELFYSCPRVGTPPANLASPISIPDGDDDDPHSFSGTLREDPKQHTVSARLLFQKFAKQISVLKTEAELMMCDEDGDGRVTLGELEAYIRDLVPTIVVLQQELPPSMTPYYCCSAARRIFWAMDVTERGSIQICDLVRHAILDEWLQVQMLAEDQTRNWFSVAISTQLKEKFDTLDSRGAGALTLEDMKKYKKGIPMVVDDGLPPDASPLSTLFIERIFENWTSTSSSSSQHRGSGTTQGASSSVTALGNPGEMSFERFVDFVIAIEFLPNCYRPLLFWNALDYKGEGKITPSTAHSFFKETHAKLLSAGVDAAAMEIILQEVFDIIPTAEPLIITKQEFVTANQCGLFAALLIDCLAFYAYENREQK